VQVNPQKTFPFNKKLPFLWYPELRFPEGLEEDARYLIVNRPMLKKYVLVLLFFLSLYFPAYKVFSSENVPHSATRLDFVLNNIKENEKRLRTFTAKIIQTRESPLLREKLHSKGMVYFDHDGKILLKFTEPSRMLVLLKNNALIVFYPDLSKVIRRYMGKSFVGKYFGIGQPVEELYKQYSIQMMDMGGSGGYHLELIPRDSTLKRHIVSIEVTISPQNWLPEEICINENKGDRTVLRLDFLSINEPLPAGIFAISLPEDYENLH
jgi:outer membrane lipoprotein-sorting protein